MIIAQRFRAITLVVLALGMAALAHAGEPSTAPILRIEAGAHVLPITLLDLDRVRNRAITAGYDKTVRIWQLPELRLVRTLRVPIEAGNEGVLFAAAVSPDGRHVAVGGWTGWQWNQSASVYVFDSETGALIRRVGGFPRLVSALGYTADGRHLVVGMQGEGGLRILDAASFREVASDPEYRGNVVDISSAAPGGWLVTTALDGALRVYDATHHLVQRQPMGISRRPGNTAVSADGQSFALGFSDLPVVAVFRLPDLHLQFVARIESEPGQKGLCCVAWAADGSLVATGEHADDRALVFRWSKEGKLAGPPIDLGRHRAGGKMLLDDGSMLLTTDEPRLAIVSGNGQVIRELGSPALDLSLVGDGLLLSPEAGRVAWRLPDGYIQAMDLVRQGLFESPGAPGSAMRAVRACSAGAEPGSSACSAVRRGLRDTPEQKTYLENREPDVPPPDMLSTIWTAPRRQAAGRSIDCKDAEHPVLDGKPIVLDALERCTAWSYGADGEALIVGTNWSLRRYGRGGQALWRVYTQGKVHAVNLSADGRYVVAALSDGTLRWFDPNSGQERFGLFLHANERDWVLWRPDGYYAASPEGDQFVGWHVNDGQDKEARFYRAVQFERLLYRPDLVRAQFDPTQTAADAGSGASIEKIAAIEPPAIRITTAAAGPGGRPSIAIDVDSRGTPITEYRVYLNGIPILNPAERTLKEGERLRFKRRVAFEATGDGDQLRVEAFNGRSMGLAEYYLRAATANPAPQRRGNLYLLAVGVNHFDHIPKGPDRILDDLEFAAQDADAFARLMQGAQGHPYERVHVKVLSDRGNLPTRRAVVEALPFLQRAGADDTVVLFLASHGFSDPAGNYFFVPRDATQQDIREALAGRFVDREPKSLVSWRILFDAMRDSAGRRLLIVDTCQSLAVAGSFDARSLKKRTAASRFAMLTASQRNEYSQEYPQGGHGLFTFALLEALKRPAGAAKQRVTVEDAFEQTSRVVKQLGDARTRQTPQLIAPSFLADTPLVAW